ncbi:pyridoxamine 5'-phosphate oxidase family protein [Neobacillus sp. D3-1R]|uniref:pyridoxamine 5'-phosphate oxidase family protein n=1 Tax=Neobacillus sp. D3-1R TaxID=3445778 RepID=UPI003FA115C6
MNQEQLREKIEEILNDSNVGTLATVEKNKPHSRYMTFHHEGLTLYTATSTETHKIEELEQNPNVHILLGYEGKGYGDGYLEIEGTAKIRDDELKTKLWNEKMANWFDGPNDPNYIVLQIDPSQIRLMNNEGDSSPNILQL